MTARKASFPPVVDSGVRLLVLGSLPGEASLAATRYYAHPQNGFWRLIGAAIGQELEPLPYDDRLRTLLAARVGLWDVVATATRAGSLDTAIRDHLPNDLVALAQSLPELRAIAFNGGKAAEIGTRALGPAPRWTLVRLPSSSPAYTLPLAEKRAAWLGLRAFIAD